MRVPGWKAKRLNSAVAGVTVLSCALVGVLAGCGSAEAEGSPLDGVTDPPGDEASALPGGDATADGGETAGSGSDSNAEGPTEFPEVEVPQYTTDLDLSPEQIIEADEVLKVLEKEVWFANQTFQTGELNEDLARQIMTDDRFSSFRDDALSILEDGARLKNEIKYSNYELIYAGPSKEGGREYSIYACLNNGELEMRRPDGTNYFENQGGDYTLEHILVKTEGSWKLDRRNWVEGKCL